MPKQFLTVREVAKLLGVTPLTIRNWDKKGKLQAYRNPVNNYRLYKINDVEKLLKEIEATKGQGIEEVKPEKKVKRLEIEEL